jgi:hypothetical protein
VGPGPCIRDWTIVFSGDGGRTAAGGDSLRVWRFAFSAPGDPHNSCMTCGLGPPCQRLDYFGARWARFFAASRGASGRVFLEKGFASRVAVTLLHSLHSLCPFAFELSAPLCIRAPLLFTVVVAMASLVHLERFQSEEALNLVRNLLGWGAPVFAGSIRAGASPLGGLAVGEFVLFVSYLSCGLAWSLAWSVVVCRRGGCRSHRSPRRCRPGRRDQRGTRADTCYTRERG